VIGSLVLPFGVAYRSIATGTFYGAGLTFHMLAVVTLVGSLLG